MCTATLTENSVQKPDIEKAIQTSKIRALITQLPIIAGCEDAERLSHQFAITYDYSYQDGTPFDCTQEDIDLPGKRLSVVNPSKHNPYYPQKAEIGFARLVIAEFRTYLQKQRITVTKMQEVLDKFEKIAQVPDEDIDSIMTYQQAVTMGFWWL